MGSETGIKVFREREGRRKSRFDRGPDRGLPMSRPVPKSVASLGVYWATRITSIGLEFALPPLAGGYLDRRSGTGSLWTIVGAVFGFLTGMVHLIAIAREASKSGTVGSGRIESGESRTSSDETNESGVG